MATAEGPPRVADFDELVDEVLARKGPAKYKDGFSEENWEEELERVPLFMTRPPGEVDPASSPALAALQDLIYKEDTPYRRAMAHKEDGNEHFKKKRYKEAIAAYSEGVARDCGDKELMAILYCNRATSQFHLGNYRSALSDADHAHQIQPRYMKAITRAVECCLKLRRFNEALKWCDTGLGMEEKHSGLKQLKAKATVEKKRQERDSRKVLAAEKAKSQKDLELVQIIKARGVTLSGAGEDGTEVDLTSPHPAGVRVHLSPDGVLVWPVLLLYPEYEQSDFIAAFRESDRFADHLREIFETPAPWDVESKYPLQALQVYYEDGCSVRLWRVDPEEETLGSVLRRKSFVVSSGTPVFIVLSSLSSHMPHFLRQFSK